MKLLLLLVSAIAVFTLDSPDFPDGHQEFDSANKVQQLVEKAVVTLDSPDEHQEFDSANEVQQQVERSVDDGTVDSGSSEIMETLMKERKGDHETQLRRSKCKARNDCVFMGGFCVINTTHCEGRLVDGGCKGRDCQCCVPAGDLDSKMETLVEKLNRIIQNQECPPGFFTTNGTSSGCYKLFNDVNRNSAAADQKCRDEGMLLAKTDTDAVEVRQHIVETYGSSTLTWVGAKADGSHMRWKQGNSIIPSTNPYWNPGHYSNSNGRSLALLTLTSQMNSEPSTPFYSRLDGYTGWTLCEQV